MLCRGHREALPAEFAKQAPDSKEPGAISISPGGHLADALTEWFDQGRLSERVSLIASRRSFGSNGSALHAPTAARHRSLTWDAPPVTSDSSARSPPSAPTPGSVRPATGSLAHRPPLRSRPTLPAGALSSIGSSPARLAALRLPAASARLGCRLFFLAFMLSFLSPLFPFVCHLPPFCKKMKRTPKHGVRPTFLQEASVCKQERVFKDDEQRDDKNQAR